MSAFYFSSKSLKDLAARHKDAYVSAEPFPHIVIDNFLPEEVLNPILEEFPQPKDMGIQFNTAQEKKLADNRYEAIPPVTRHILSQFNSATFCEFLEELTGIKGIIPDPHLIGGGLHQIQPGGYLKIHADFNYHERLRIDRRLNLLLYLNKDWQEDYGGHLELWETDMSQCAKRILPVFNRCVVFSTTSDSYHGHPDPLTCPEGRSRRSLALYYYTNGRPEEEKRAQHSTLFKTRPDEKLRLTPADLVRKVAPPILLDAAKFVKNRLRP